MKLRTAEDVGYLAELVLDNDLEVVRGPDRIPRTSERVGVLYHPEDVRVSQGVVEARHLSPQSYDVLPLPILLREHPIPDLKVLLERLSPVLAGCPREPELLHLRLVASAGVRLPLRE